MENKFSKFINLQGKYLTSLLILLAMSIGNVWADTTYSLFDGEGNFNSEDFFCTKTPADVNYTLSDVNYPKSITFSGTLNAYSYNKNSDRYIRYDLKTTKVVVEIIAVVAKNKDRSISWTYVNEPGTSTTASDFVSSGTLSLTKNTSAESIKKYTLDEFETTTNTSFVISVPSSAGDVQILQVNVTEKGTDLLKKPGEDGYAFRFQQGTSTSGGAGGRHGGGKAVEIPYDGGKFVCCLNSEHTAGTGCPAKITTKGTHYIKFTTTAYSKVNVSVGSSNAYYISDSKNPSSGTTYNADASVEIDAGTWYIVPNGADVTIKNISFESATPAAKHHVTYALGEGTGTTPTQADVAEGAKFTLHNGTTGVTAPSNKIFVGWNDGTTTYNGGAEYTMGTSDVTLTAQWASAHTVSFAANGGGSSMESVKVKDGATYTIPACGFTPEDANHTFSHWAISGVAGKTTGNPDETFTMPAGDVTLTAQWAVSYDVTKGSHTNGDFTISPASGAAGTEITLNATGDENYMLGSWAVVKTSDGTDAGVAVTNNKFNLPAFDVTVNATFVADTRDKVLYVTKNNEATTKSSDKLYEALKDIYNVKIVGAASEETVTNYALVVLHESVDGSSYNATAVAAAKGGAVPVLNTKSYFYNNANTTDQRWNWGTPNAGTSVKGCTPNAAYCNIADHPIFDGVIDEGFVEITDEAAAKCMQPIGAFTTGKEGYTLATTPNAGDGNGCAIHELTPAQRGVASGKYLMISVSSGKLNALNANGQKLFQNAAAYLIDGAASWTPVLKPVTTGITATPAASYSEGDNIALSITATNVDAETTYTWYKGATLDAAKAAGAIQTAKTAAAGGTSYAKANCEVADAGIYWCVISAGCEISASLEVTVTACTKPGTPANLTANDLAYTTATLGWDECDNSNGYKITIIKKSDESVVVDWTACETNAYAATGLTQGTAYTFKVKAVGASGYCEYGLEASKDFTTTAPSIADLVTIDADYTFEPSVSIPAGTLSADSKFFAAGSGDCDMSDGKMRVKENRALAFKVADKAKIKVTFATKSGRQIQLGTALSDGNYDTYGSSESSPYTFDVVTTGGVVYLTAHSDQLYFSKLEIIYPRTVTYDLNGGTGTQPTESAHYEGDKFTVHNGEIGITAPSGQEFDKWKDQDNADVAGGAEYTMPAKAVTLTAQWRAETVKYTVTYDLDDYTAGVAPTETNKAAGDVFAIKAAPSRAGYAFLGWLCNVDASTYQATDNYTMTAATTTFTAIWKQEFQVTYNLKGHGDPIAAQVVLDGGKVTKPADPTEMLYDFGGWYKEAACTNAWDFDNDVVTEDTELFAKWTEFDGCAYLAPVASGDALTVGANVALKTGSLGGTVKVAGLSGTSKIAYNAAGLAFTGGQGDSIRVTLENKMMVGTKITVRLQANDTGSRGLKLRKLDKTEVATLGWSAATVGAVESFTYTVVANDGLDGKKAFILSRNNTVYLKYISVENCAPEEFVVTYKDGSTTMGTEDVYKNAHPTATGIVTKKLGYSFLGWSETDGGALVDLDDITITAAKDLYAKYEAIDCPTSGTVYKFVVKDELASETLPAITDKEMSSYVTTTGHGYLTYTATSNGKAVVNNDGTIQMKDATAAYLKVELDCALGAGDQIRAHISSNPMRVQVGTTYDSNKDIILAKDNYVFVDITSDMVGKQVLYITRSTNGNANIADFEIYRRPAVTGVELADMTMRVGQTKTPEMTLTPAAGLVTSQAWTIESATPAGIATIDAATGAISATAEGTLTVKVVLNGNDALTDECTVTIVDVITQQNVTKSTVWNWQNASSVNEIKLTDSTDPKKNEGFVMANVNVYNNTNFESDKLYVEGEYIIREGDKANPYFQGQTIKFNATIAGGIRVKFSNTGGNPARELYINGVGTGITSANGTLIWSDYIEVPVGEVSITAYLADKSEDASQKYIRVSEIEFLALAHQRTSGYNVGDLGTVCLEDATVIDGATLYELAGLNENGYLAFDEIQSGELEAGKPYLFEVTNPSQISFYKPVGAAHADAESATNGMIGTFSGTTLYQNVTENYYYFSGRHIWRVNDFSVEIPIPAHRCYIDYDVLLATPAPQQAAPGRRRVTMGVNGKQTPTGIDAINASEKPMKIMIDGQIYILRGEKMFDATGRLVK